jgi:DNA-binding MurR/RpiR family transcriptional regulator
VDNNFENFAQVLDNSGHPVRSFTTISECSGKGRLPMRADELGGAAVSAGGASSANGDGTTPVPPAPVPPAPAVGPAPAAPSGDGPAGRVAIDSVLARVRAGLPEFTGALQRVAELVLGDPASVARSTIVELAERSGTSPATVTRFCRALGFEGYSDLRIGIAGETGWAARSGGWTDDIGREIQPSDPLERVLGQVMAADTRAMQDTAALIDLREVERAADAIAAASRVDIYGASGSALVGAEMQFCLHRIGVAAWAWTDVHNGLTSSALLHHGDVALGISHSGQTRETIEMVAEAGSHGATTVVLTSFPRSPLAEVADIVLLTAAQATTFRPDALSARHPQLVVLDLLYIAVAQRTHERAHAAFQVTARAVAGHRSAKEVEPA